MLGYVIILILLNLRLYLYSEVLKHQDDLIQVKASVVSCAWLDPPISCLIVSVESLESLA